jgi:hypothetical protein
MGNDTEQIKKRAPTLYVIITLKLLKGLLFVALAVVAYTLSDNDLPAEYRNVLHHLRVNPERKFWADLARQVGSLTESKVLSLGRRRHPDLQPLLSGRGSRAHAPNQLGRLAGDRRVGFFHPNRNL